ncbi:DUF4129 domain-containing protein [Microbacterium natoriense]
MHRRPDPRAGRRMERGWLVIVVTGLFCVVMIAAALQGAPSIRPISSTSEPLPAEPLPEISGTPSPTPTPPPEPGVVAGVLGAIMLGILVLLCLVGLVLLVLWVIRMLILWRDRPLPHRDGGAVGLAPGDAPSDVEPHVVEAAIRRGIAGALEEIEGHAVPAEAIVAAWIGLEESAADAGITRGQSETPGEFTVRIISRRSGISADAQTLLRLYERVRFGTYVAVEDDRSVARAALQSIEAGWR